MCNSLYLFRSEVRLVLSDIQPHFVMGSPFHWFLALHGNGTTVGKTLELFYAFVQGHVKFKGHVPQAQMAAFL